MINRSRDRDRREQVGIVQRRPTVEVPPSLEAAAFIVKNGERLWTAQDALALIDWLRNIGYAVLGGEVYYRHEIGWGTYVRDWQTGPPRAENEPWGAFVERTSIAAARFLKNELTSQELPAPLHFVAFVSEIDPDARRT